MPGVLPLKTIQLNSSSQSRIAQACDRCRSKKIRCDGIQPNCTPCQAVNFDCKTSDKLSRKAYPKGYTSSLEERVRELETEIRQLKDLLDEKDEKIDILSKMGRSSSGQLSSPTPPASTPSDHGREDSFKVRQSQSLYGRESGSEYFMGASSSRSFVDAFKARVQEVGKLSIPFDATSLFPTLLVTSSKTQQPTSPSRVVSDQLINVFFQEWAPLFPILHRPTFLRTYEAFLLNPILKDPREHAQMYLVFGIAALSSLTNMDLLFTYESQWRKALDAAVYESSIEILQSLVLAQLYCIVKGDSKRLLHYKGIAVNMAYRLGLHQCQAPFNLGALTRETRKRLFWSLYTLDCFSAATLGLPKLLKDADIETEDPADVDDENVSERGFQATLPGEHTKLSSALALFRASRLLSKVLDDIYHAGAGHEVPLSKVHVLSDELDSWRESLPQHLRLEFTQDTLNVHITGNRSPILALIYFHIRSCIHRPVVAANLGNKALGSVLALADSSKRIYQIMKLLEQRQMSFTMPLNRTEILSLAGVGLLFQALNLRAEGKLIRENQRLVAAIAEILSCVSKPASTTLIKMSCTLLGPDNSSSPQRRSSAEGSMSPPSVPVSKSSPRDQLQALAARFSFSGSRNQKKSPPGSRRGTMPTPPASQSYVNHPRSGSTASMGSARSAASDSMASGGYENAGIQATGSPSKLPNLDFFPIGSQPQTPDLTSSLKQANGCDWDHLVNQYQPYDAHTPTGQYSNEFMGSDTFSQLSPPELTSLDWSPTTWSYLEASVSSNEPLSATAHSVLSFSDESLASAEDLSSCDLSSDYPAGLVMPADEFTEYPEFGVTGDYHRSGLAV